MSKVTYAYTAGTLGSAASTETYTYGNAAWGDQLTEYNGTAISYDAIGNPTTFNGYALTWHGRQLKKMKSDSQEIKFLYNADGIRTVKEVNTVEHIYTLNGTQIVSEAWGDKLLIYLYDESGSPVGLQYRTSSYDTYEFDTFYFEKNLQGDIIAVYNTDGDKIGSYTYDAWGNCTVNVVLGNTALERNVVRSYNPFRYRGYYYDTETGLYYLQSRYYNPAWGRFLNADGYVNTNGDLIGFNMYAYCGNNPIKYIDPLGNETEETTKTHWYFYVQRALFGNDDQEETQRKLRYIKDLLVQDLRDIWDCTTWDWGIGFGLGGSISIGYFDGTIMLRQDILTIQKRSGENPIIGMASDAYTTLVLGEVFNTGRGLREMWKFSIEKGMIPIYQEQVYELPGDIQLDLGAAGYLIIGGTCKIGFHATEYARRKYEKWKKPDPYSPWEN